jgi:hypothetical protein
MPLGFVACSAATILSKARFGSWSAPTFFGPRFTIPRALLASIVGVFAEIPIVSYFAFWVMAANYLIAVAGTRWRYPIIRAVPGSMRAVRRGRRSWLTRLATALPTVFGLVRRPGRIPLNGPRRAAIEKSGFHRNRSSGRLRA